MQSDQLSYIPILLQFLLAAGFVVNHYSFLATKRKSEIKNKNFECGVEGIGNARIPFSVKYFLVAILFVLFDVEVIFLYPWAINFKEWKVWSKWSYLWFSLVGFSTSSKESARMGIRNYYKH
jgi:NADH-quinone oxidoreductase subunit A